MTVHERAEALAAAGARFPELSPPTAAEMLAALDAELGGLRVLEEFVPYAGHRVRAFAPRCILHVISGNTPHAALQSITRGLLLGSRNLVKFPSCGLGAIESFGSFLPDVLARQLECSHELEPGWKETGDAWVVFGSDETVAALRAECPPTKIFEAHGHRVSFCVVGDDPAFVSCADAARAVSLFDQAGCLSPHVIYVAGDAPEYAARLAAAMEEYHSQNPGQAPAFDTAARILQLRETMGFQALSDPAVGIWQSAGLPGWTVVFEEDPVFRFSPLGRSVYVKPLPADLDGVLGGVREHLGAIGIYPACADLASRVAGLGASRICTFDAMQSPAFAWPAEGRKNLASLVRWVDLEMET